MSKRKQGMQAGRELEDVLDDALADTFPASDPFSVGQATGTEPPVRPVDRKAPRFDISPPESPGSSSPGKRTRPASPTAAKRKRKA